MNSRPSLSVIRYVSLLPQEQIDDECILLGEHFFITLSFLLLFFKLFHFSGDASFFVKVKSGYQLQSKKTGKNLGTYPTKAGAEKRERQVQYFKHADEDQHPNVGENFADGRNPQDKGDSARHGISKGMSIADLKKVRSSDSASPRKKQLAHWQINMRQGRKK